MRAFTLLSTLALSLLSISPSFAAPAPVHLPASAHTDASLFKRSPAPVPVPFGVSAAVAVAASSDLHVKAHARVGAHVHKRGGCDGCASGEKPEGLLKALVDLKANVDVEVKKLDSLAVSAYTTANLNPILASIHASIELAFTKCKALVGKADAIIFASVDGKSDVLVTIGQIGGVLGRIIVALSITISKIVARVGVSVCGVHLAQIGVALHALVSVCIKLVPDLLSVLAPLVEKVVVDIKACVWTDLAALVSVKA